MGLLRACLRTLAPALAAACLLLAPAAAQPLQPVPALTAHVIDQTGTLDDLERQGLEDKLSALEQAKGAQVVVLLVATTKPEDDASYANRVGNTWKIGRKGVGDGVLLLVAKDDRKIRIEVAKTLEGAIPDLAAKQIIDDAIRPAFRSGDFAGGLRAGVDQLAARINGEPLPPPAARAQQRHDPRPSGDSFQFNDLLVFLLFLVPVVGGLLRRMLGRPLGAVAAGAGFGAVVWLVTTSLVFGVLGGLVALFITLVSGFGGFLPIGRGGWGTGGGGWGGGSSGGGGGGGGGSWGSGGGGDFGGGGASGDW